MHGHRRSLTPFAVGILAVTAAAWACGAEAAPISQGKNGPHLALTLSARQAELGSRYSVTLTGAQPGILVFFAARPLDITGFGGGNMGARRADRSGRIRFVYPAGVYAWELGRWRITASYPECAQPAAAVITIVAG